VPVPASFAVGQPNWLYGLVPARAARHAGRHEAGHEPRAILAGLVAGAQLARDPSDCRLAPPNPGMPMPIEETAALIADARLARTPLARLPDGLRPADEAAAYAVQARVHDRLA